MLTALAAFARSYREAQGYLPLLMFLPMIPTLVLMVAPVRTQLWMLAVPFLGQNQLILRVLRGGAIAARGLGGQPRRVVLLVAASCGGSPRGSITASSSPPRPERSAAAGGRLPADAVVLAVIARAAPERAVLRVDQDRVDRAGRAGFELRLVAAPDQFLRDPLRHRRQLSTMRPGCDSCWSNDAFIW